MPTKTNIRVINRNIDDPIAMDGFRNQLRQLDNTLQNFTTLRRRIGGDENQEPRRDYNAEFGYPDTSRITLPDYWTLYHRNSVAKKVVDILPSHSWQLQPMVHENDDPDNETAFEKAFMEVGDKLMGESFYTGERGDPIWDYTARVDKVAGLGGYGALLIGVGGPDGENLEEPLTFNDEDTTITRELIFLRAFPEISANISEFETDSTNPRFNLPTFYELIFDDPEILAVTADTSVRPTAGSRKVHWTRLLHYTHPVVSNEIRHIPDMLPSYNRLLDLGKLYGGSAEMYFRGGLPGYSLETHPSLGGDVEIDVDALRDMMEHYQNSLQRFIATTGMSVNSLAPQVADPMSQINVQLEAICIGLDCPKRIFVGSERGELASSQDSRHWNDVIVSRRNNHLTPGLIVPLVNRFILLGLLPRPSEDGFKVTWPEIETLSPLEKADQALKITQAIIAYVNGNGLAAMPLPHFLTMVLGFGHTESESIIEVLAEEGLKEHLKAKAIAAVVDPEADVDLAGSAAGEIT